MVLEKIDTFGSYFDQTSEVCINKSGKHSFKDIQIPLLIGKQKLHSPLGKFSKPLRANKEYHLRFPKSLPELVKQPSKDVGKRQDRSMAPASKENLRPGQADRATAFLVS